MKKIEPNSLVFPVPYQNWLQLLQYIGRAQGMLDVLKTYSPTDTHDGIDKCINDLDSVIEWAVSNE